MEETPIRIRPMTLADLPAAVAIEAASFSQPWSVQSFAAELEKPHAVCFVAAMGEEIVGWAGLESLFGEAEVTNIAVAPAHRGKGIGKRLTAALLAHSRLQGDTLLGLEVRPSNAAAISLYEGLGFVLIGKRPGFYDFPREDALLYRYIFSKEESK